MILDGKKVRDNLLNEYKTIIDNNNLKLKLAIIYVGNNSSSKLYINNKEKYCNLVGIKTEVFHLEENVTNEDIILLIKKLNNDVSVTGIILQSPITFGLDYEYCVNHILPYKDIDGFTKDNLYNLVHNKKGLKPCTVKGIIKLLDYYNISLDGKNVCIIGRGDIVGKPLAIEMINKNATVTLCHSHTKNISNFAKNADLIVSATGKKHLITEDMVSEKAIIIDVGIEIIDGKIFGDVDFDNIVNKVEYITPNPGGVGPMTIAMIVSNIIDAYYMQNKE